MRTREDFKKEVKEEAEKLEDILEKRPKGFTAEDGRMVSEVLHYLHETTLKEEVEE